MKVRPAYFDSIRLKAERRWDQLEQDPELAGPWHQLFKQVQSPRHILSELLQNADDAGATEASVRIENQVFVFTHNGEDFSEEHFASLCRFGYSNKRSLHTIGFRGIGFKSVFSLGGKVELFTPTLAVSFNRKRFSEPHWLNDEINTNGKTLIRVGISDQHLQKDVEKNLDDWLKSPLSLLFFKHIRKLKIGVSELNWIRQSSGPVPDSEWMKLSEKPEDPCLVIRSVEESFPSDALSEIKQERMLGVEEESDFPPCKIEIVLGAKGRLYVVLPTGVETKLPFACNAPFIQDPARMKIKDPETSPTNRWLLERAGQLAASTMLNWLGSEKIAAIERADAYSLLPDVDRKDNSLEGVCGTAVEEAFSEIINDVPILLKQDGVLVQKNKCLIIPNEIANIWPVDQAVGLLNDEGKFALSQHVKTAYCEKLLSWGLVEEIDKEFFLTTLENKHLPKPKTWEQVLNLWGYIAPEVTGYEHFGNNEDLCIVPVQGKEILYSAKEVVRLGESKLLQSDADWNFLASHLVVLNQNWPRFLAEKRRESVKQEDKSSLKLVEAAYAVLAEIGLDDTSNVDNIIEKFALEFFARDGIKLAECVQLTHIVAKLSGTVGESFRYATRDNKLRLIDNNILYDENYKLEELLPDKERESSLLHLDYTSQFVSCSKDEWTLWISSGKSNLLTFLPLINNKSFSGRLNALSKELKRRECSITLNPRYSVPWFIINDWDYRESIWNHWQKLSEENPSIWRAIMEKIIFEKETYWLSKTSAQIFEYSTNGHSRLSLRSGLTPNWIMRLREIPCLPDTRGFCRKPSELLRRTPETEYLIDVEPFVDGHLDKEKIRPLLDILGVRSTPTSPERLLGCLRALSNTMTPPIQEVEKWYRRLDQMLDNCSTNDFAIIKKAFHEEKIIFTEDCGWSLGSGVFLTSDEEDAPGVAIIRASCRDLTLWRKIGIAERPTVDLAIQWLKELPNGKMLSQDDSRRVQILLRRHAVRIWNECRHWINLSGEWVSIEKLEYSISMQTLVPWSHLHVWVKQKTADFQRLPTEITSLLPFSNLPHVGERIEDRFHSKQQFSNRSEKKPWLNQIGDELSRVILDDKAEESRIRALAFDLAETAWQMAPGLELVPYIDGTPAGTPRRADVLWLNKILYVDQISNAKLARIVPERLGRIFGRADVVATLNYCFGRSSVEIREYIEENFKLAPRNEILKGKTESTTTDVQSSSNETEVIKQVATLPEIDENSEEVIEVDTIIDDKEDDQSELGNADVPLPKARSIPKPTPPPIIERFALKQGYRKDGDERFYHGNGSSIVRTHGERFPWERLTNAGEKICYYLPKEHCLENDPLQLDADVWGLIEKFPETYALLLLTPEDEPIEMFGTKILSMRDNAKLTLYPATYRLVFEYDR